MSEHDPNTERRTETERRNRGLGVLFSLSADRLIAVGVIIIGILLGVWLFGH
jgi:hypothetical protein